jgi:DNA end-binding protein Ku
LPNGCADLDTLRFRDELRDASGLELPPEGLKGAGVAAKEIDLAKRLVDDLTERWNAARYRNTYHDDLMARIRQKIKEGRTTEITEPAREATSRSAQIIDLATLLKQSLDKGRTERTGTGRGIGSAAAKPRCASCPAKHRRASGHCAATSERRCSAP